MTNQKALEILKLFYYGCSDMLLLSKKAKVSREEVREILRGARDCGLISYNTQDYNETFWNVKKQKLEPYLRAKGAIK